MKLEIDEKKKIGYLSFSWKEIWILIKKRKLSLAPNTIEHITNKAHVGPHTPPMDPINSS